MSAQTDHRVQTPALVTPGPPRRTRHTLTLDLGTRLRRARLAERLTIDALAARMGVSESFVRAMERGRAAPSLVTAEAWLAVLPMTADVAADLIAQAVRDAGRSRS